MVRDIFDTGQKLGTQEEKIKSKVSGEHRAWKTRETFEKCQ